MLGEGVCRCPRTKAPTTLTLEAHEASLNLPPAASSPQGGASVQGESRRERGCLEVGGSWDPSPYTLALHKVTGYLITVPSGNFQFLPQPNLRWNPGLKPGKHTRYHETYLQPSLAFNHVFLPQVSSFLFFQVLSHSLSFCVLWGHCLFGHRCLGEPAALCFFAPGSSLGFCTPRHEFK